MLVQPVSLAIDASLPLRLGPFECFLDSFRYRIKNIFLNSYSPKRPNFAGLTAE